MQRNLGKFDYVSYKYEFPGGKLESGESQMQALMRELSEEMNLNIVITQDDFFMTVEHTYPDFSITMHSYICNVDDRTFSRNEHISHTWLKAYNLDTLDWAAADLPIVKRLKEVMLINLFLQEKKILSRQLLCLSGYTLLDRIGFFDRVSAVRIAGDYGQWIKCFLKGIIVSADKSINIINKFIELKAENQAKIRSFGQAKKTSLMILDYLEENPIIDLKNTAEELKLSFNTVAKTVEHLQELGIIKQGNNLMRNRCFAYSEYLEIIR